jgi:hypothetical protein
MHHSVYTAASGLKYAQFKIYVLKRLFCILWQFSSWELLHRSFNSYLNWFICIFLTLMVVDLISSYPTHWFPLQAYGTICWSSHCTFHVLSFSQICTSKKSYHVMFKLEKRSLNRKFTRERMWWKSLKVLLKIHGFSDFLKYVFMSLILCICFSYI